MQNISNHPTGHASRESSSLDIYLKEIHRYPLLDREEEHELGRRARGGDQGAIDALVQANLRFVVSIAKKYVGTGASLEDLINEGNLGLVKAAHRFDPDRGYKFISYAVWWIRQAILHSLSQRSRLIRLPLNKARDLTKVGRAARDLIQDLGREPTALDIAEALDMAPEDVERIQNIAGGHLSLDDPFSEEKDDHAYIDSLEDTQSPPPDDRVNRDYLGRDVARALATLSERERTIMTLYFGLGGEQPMTLQDIGAELNLTRERIRQIKEQVIEKLRAGSSSKMLQPYA